MPFGTRQAAKGIEAITEARSKLVGGVSEQSLDEADRILADKIAQREQIKIREKAKMEEKAAVPAEEAPSLTPLEDGVYRDDAGKTFIVENGKIRSTAPTQEEISAQVSASAREVATGPASVDPNIPTQQLQQRSEIGALGKPDTSQSSSVEAVYGRDESGNIFFLEGDEKISSKDKIFYHSTTADFENFEIKDSPTFDYGDGESAGGIFFSPDPSGGEYVLDNGRGRFLEGSNTRPVKLDLGDRPVILSDLYPDLMVKSLEYQAKILKTLARDGATSAIFPNGEVVVFSPEQITSAIK